MIHTCNSRCISCVAKLAFGSTETIGSILDTGIVAGGGLYDGFFTLLGKTA